MPRQPCGGHQPCLARAYALQLVVTLTPTVYADLKASWTLAKNPEVNALQFAAWVVTRNITDGGTLQFVDASNTVIATPPSAGNWHRVAQVQAAVAPRLFAAGWAVGQRQDCSA